MTDLKIEGTKDTLEIFCTPGEIKMTGNSITSNAQSFFNPINVWVEEYIKAPKKSTEITLQFNYIDTASVHYVFSILKKLKNTHANNHEITVNWYFEFDDPELLEVGEIIEARLDVKFNYIEYSQ